MTNSPRLPEVLRQVARPAERPPLRPTCGARMVWDHPPGRGLAYCPRGCANLDCAVFVPGPNRG